MSQEELIYHFDIVFLKGVQKFNCWKKLTFLKAKAAGPDLIPGRILRMLNMLAPIVYAIFTQSLDTGELPRDWSLANIAPIFKKGIRSLAENFRPVSLTKLHYLCLSTLFAGTFWTMLRTTKFSPTSNMVFVQAEIVRHSYLPPHMIYYPLLTL